MYNRCRALYTPVGVFSRAHHNKHRGKILGIRREDVNPWERRAPLAPHNVQELTKAGVVVLVQPSNHRAIQDMVRLSVMHNTASSPEQIYANIKSVLKVKENSV